MNVYFTAAPIASERAIEAVLRSEGLEGLGPTISRTANGKPYFTAPNAPKFNLTHTDGLTAVAIGDMEVGIDAERIQPRKLDALRARLSEEERREDFYTLWTAKEAYIKFRGGTIAGMLPSLSFRRGTLFENGRPVEAWLEHVNLAGCTVCVCLERRAPLRVLPL